MENLEELDKFLEKYNFPKVQSTFQKYNFPKPNQEEIEDLNRPITSMEIETVIRNLPAKKKVQGQMTSQVNSTKNLEKS